MWISMNMNKPLPTESQCLSIMREHHMLPNIIDHSIQVKNVSMAIVNHLKAEVRIRRELVLCGALLHDIAKTYSIDTGEPYHDLKGADMLRGMGLDDVAAICESHVNLKYFRPEGPLEDREIVNYADKRVMPDTIVSLEERMDDLVLRYGFTSEKREHIRKNREFTLILERKIVSHLTMDMESVISSI
jgi:putative nucleotidyltransferase with HDIG domain